MPRKFSRNFFSLLLVIGVLFIVSACENQSQKEERLARQYCGSCHLFPDPSLLTKGIWEQSVLPEMSFRMGFPDYNMQERFSPEELVKILQTIPSRPLVTEQEWQAISNYFAREAPDSLIIPDHSIVDTIHQFTPSLVSFENDIITVLKADSINHKLFVGTRSSMLYELNTAPTVIKSTLLASPPSHLFFEGTDCIVSLMGIMDPNDQAKGEIVHIQGENGKITQLLDSIQRPVYVEKTDYNRDSLTDYLVCAFGNYTGALLLYEATTTSFRKHVLSPFPGARKTISRDFTNDGTPDILALITQGDERLVLYVNKGNFNFEEKILLRFPPVYGSNYFETIDFNSDGHFDILYTNGDNADLSPTLKPYHAVRIFENDGKNNFNETWSYAMPGASQAMAKDFDKDGDLDIAALSFFPDFKKYPEQSFIYFENTGHTFKPQTTHVATWGRWIVMETADYDTDGDIDIVLGALNFRAMGATNESFERWQNKKTPLLILKNNLYSHATAK